MAETQAHRSLLDLLDEASLTRTHLWLWFLGSAGTLLDGFALFVLGVSLPLVATVFSMSPSTLGLIGAALVLGSVAGSLAGGPLSDRWGRRPLLIADMLVLASGAFVSLLAGGPRGLLVGQLVVGIGIGMDFPVSGAFVSELMPKRDRGRMMVATIACQAIGMLLGGALALVLLTLRAEVSDWRALLIAECALAVIFFLFRFRVPESPRWSMAHGRNQGAARALERLFPGERARIRALATAAATQAHVVVHPAAKHPLGIRTLFAPPYRIRTALTAAPWFLMDIATYGIGLFTPILLSAVHLSGGASPVARDLGAARGSGAVDLFLLFGFLLGLWAVPRFGRIRMQLLGFLGMGIGMSVLALSSLLSGGAAHHVILVFTGFIVFNLLMNVGPNSTTFTLAPELFPTQLRASASGFSASCAKLGATLGVFFLPILKASIGMTLTLFLVAALSLLALVITAYCAREIPGEAALEAFHRPGSEAAFRQRRRVGKSAKNPLNRRARIPGISQPTAPIRNEPLPGESRGPHHPPIVGPAGSETGDDAGRGAD